VRGITSCSASGSHSHRLDAFSDVGLRQALYIVAFKVLIVHSLHFVRERIGDVECNGIPILAHKVDRALHEQRQRSGGIVQETDVARACVRSCSGPLAVVFDRGL
jgi:hypothetical protein